MKIHALIAFFVGLAGCGSTATERLRFAPMRTVAHVELGRYLGTLYEIAGFPTWQGSVDRLQAQGYETSLLVRALQVSG